MELDLWSDTDGCVCAHSEWVIMFSLDLVFMSVKLQVCPEIHSHAVLSHIHMNTSSNVLKTCRTQHKRYTFTRTQNILAQINASPKVHIHKQANTFTSVMWWMYTYTYIFRGRQTSHTHSIHARGWHLRPVTCLDDMLRSQHCASRNRRSKRSLGVSPAPVSACKAKVNLL